jgi:hypothetical protein
MPQIAFFAGPRLNNGCFLLTYVGETRIAMKAYICPIRESKNKHRNVCVTGKVRSMGRSLVRSERNGTRGNAGGEAVLRVPETSMHSMPYPSLGACTLRNRPQLRRFE